MIAKTVPAALHLTGWTLSMTPDGDERSRPAAGRLAAPPPQDLEDARARPAEEHEAALAQERARADAAEERAARAEAALREAAGPPS